MKKQEEDLTKMSIEELNIKLKRTKTSAGLLAGVIAVQFIAGISLTIMQGFNVFTIIPIAFLPILLISFTSIKKIKAEIERRN